MSEGVKYNYRKFVYGVENNRNITLKTAQKNRATYISALFLP